MASLMSTKMAASQPRHFGSRRKLPKSCLAGWSVQDTCTRDLNRHVCRGGVPQDKSTGNSPTTYQGSKMILERLRRMGYTILKDMRSSETLLREQISTHQGAAPHCADLLTAVLPKAWPHCQPSAVKTLTKAE